MHCKHFWLIEIGLSWSKLSVPGGGVQHGVWTHLHSFFIIREYIDITMLKPYSRPVGLWWFSKNSWGDQWRSTRNGGLNRSWLKLIDPLMNLDLDWWINLEYVCSICTSEGLHFYLCAPWTYQPVILNLKVYMKSVPDPSVFHLMQRPLHVVRVFMTILPGIVQL